MLEVIIHKHKCEHCGHFTGVPALSGGGPMTEEHLGEVADAHNKMERAHRRREFAEAWMRRWEGADHD